MRREPFDRPLRWRALLLIIVVSSIAIASCGGSANDNGPSTSGPVQVTLWHSMVSPVGGSLQRIVDDFNKSQTAYHVNTTFQGDFTVSLNKLIASSGSGNIPALIQLDDVSAQTMEDSGAITPVQQFIDADKYDLSDFDPKALSYYRVNGKLDSMPFNLADPILYYDRQDFIDAGLDPDNPPRTLDDVRRDSEKLVKRDAQGKVTRAGISLEIDPWFFEQMLAKQGALFANNDNGRSGRATDAVFASAQGKQVIQWWHDMVADGLAYNAGRHAEDALLALAQDRASMTIESTAVLGAVVALTAVLGKDPHQLGTGPLPAPAGKDGGIIVGGASMWILNGRPKAEQRGAWEFIKFASSPEQQAQWHADTGYLPTRLSAYKLPPAVQKEEQFPLYRTAIDQLRSSPDNTATQGAVLGDFNQVREQVTRAFEQMLAGSDPGKTLDAAAAQATKIIRDYNRTVK